jgi:hypothetical protein
VTWMDIDLDWLKINVSKFSLPNQKNVPETKPERASDYPIKGATTHLNAETGSQQETSGTPTCLLLAPCLRTRPT